MDISNYNVAEAEHTKLVEEKDYLIKEKNKEGTSAEQIYFIDQQLKVIDKQIDDLEYEWPELYYWSI